MRVFDNSRIPIVVMDPVSFQYIEFNQAAIDIYGFPSREALLRKTPADVSAKVQYDGTPSSEKALLFVEKALADSNVVFEWKHLRPNGEYWDAEVHLLSFHTNEKTFLQFSMIDISERKKYEIALLQSEEKYRTLMESLNDVVMMVDNDDKVLFVNKKFTEKLGYEESEIIGKIGYECLISPENQDIIIASNFNRLKKNKSQYEMPFIAKDGTIIDFLVSGAPIVNSEGKTIGSIGAMIDITERKKIENALRESEEKFRLLAENIPGIIYLCKNDPRWSMLFLNDEVEKITGYPKNDFLKQSLSFADIYHPDDIDIISRKFAAALEERKPFHIQYRIKHKNNCWRWLEEYGVGIERNGKIELLEGFITDITEKKKTELELIAYRDDLEQLVSERTDELAAANEELQVSNSDLMEQREALELTLTDLKITQDQLVQAEKMASLGILTAGVAHEINNPLNYIHDAAIESIIRDHYETPEDLNPLFEAVSSGVRRISGIIKSMGRYSRNENLPFTSCNIQEVLDDCLILLHNKYKNNIEIIKNYLPESPVYIANEGQLHQAFLNILANAIQAIKNKGKVTIVVNSDSQNISVSITDNGKGISSGNLNRIFDPFFTTKDPGEGTGLGLAITKKIIEEHKGTIYCKSTPGKGTTFIICFPVNHL
jgi:PAS domain S-box-containing protein